jgi:hypothetical protein
MPERPPVEDEVIDANFMIEPARKAPLDLLENMIGHDPDSHPLLDGGEDCEDLMYA